jgi:hypothetical protein
MGEFVGLDIFDCTVPLWCRVTGHRPVIDHLSSTLGYHAFLTSFGASIHRVFVGVAARVLSATW